MSTAAGMADDARLRALSDWLGAQLGTTAFSLEPASADASFRRYFRVGLDGGSRIAMDAPPEKEGSAPFVAVAGLLRQAGVHAPHIYAHDLSAGFMLLEDLGTRTYLDVLDDSNANVLFSDALEALIDWQAASRPGVLPDYDADTLQRELAMFPEWFLQRHLGLSLSAGERNDLETVFTHLTEAALAQPQVFVHRDFMPRNLMVADPNPGVIDFQDARYGPLTYDLVSLFKDAFISWPEQRIDAWLSAYWQRAGAAGLPLPTDLDGLRRDCDWLGVQRHLKVLGIFARIAHRDGKPQYLADAPRFLDYLRPIVARYQALAPLDRLLRDRVLPAIPD